MTMDYASKRKEATTEIGATGQSTLNIRLH